MDKAFEGVEQLRAQADVALSRSLRVPVEVIGFEMFNVNCEEGDLWKVTRLRKNKRGFPYAKLNGVECPHCGQEVIMRNDGGLPVHQDTNGEWCIIPTEDWRK
jgi:hypothetical protein